VDLIRAFHDIKVTELYRPSIMHT